MKLQCSHSHSHFQLLTLCYAVINGEKAVFNIPVFAQKREKTLDMLIRRAVETHLSEAPRPPLVSRKSTGEILAECEPPAVFARNKEEQRRIEFAKFGQVLLSTLPFQLLFPFKFPFAIFALLDLASASSHCSILYCTMY